MTPASTSPPTGSSRRPCSGATPRSGARCVGGSGPPRGRRSACGRLSRAMRIAAAWRTDRWEARDTHAYPPRDGGVPRILHVVVGYRLGRYFLNAVRSVRAAAPGDPLLIVDNASPDPELRGELKRMT